jgi:hypothetical protein
MPRSRPAIERFWEKVDQNGPPSPLDGTSCWLWIGSLNFPEGYGELRVTPGRKVYAHRFAYELLMGPISEDEELDHRPACPKRCVNPAHMESVSHKRNIERRGGLNRNNTSGVRGVYWSRQNNKWQVSVKHHGKIYYGGRFPIDQLAEAEQAAIALRNRLFSQDR